MANRTLAQENKRTLILEAAVRVFAEKGYHACRVGDIAEEAGVAYGLLYHYFGSKEEVLKTIFRATWGELLSAVRAVEELGEPAPEQIRKVAAIVLRSWQRDPDLIRVLVREITRSPQLQREIDEVGQAFEALERIVVRGQEEGTLRQDIDSRLAAWIFYGGLEEILTGWVLGQLPDTEDDVRQAERTTVQMICEGLLPRNL